MENAEIMKLVDSGAQFYCRQLGNASHMEFERRNHYSIIYPKPGEEGGTSVFDVTLEDLDDAKATEVIDEIKSLNVHTWWGLCISDRDFRLITGKARPIVSDQEHENDEELYMALFPEEKPAYPQTAESVATVTRVMASEDFAPWADICNSVLHGGYPIIHRANHYEICRTGLMSCYLAYLEGEPAGTAAILDDEGIASLEFVATLPQFRKRGIASSLCQRAVDDAFLAGAKVITTRAFQPAKNLYKSMGFRVYH
jgi:ribosomal protein S18 acetylase RimI-like enzyme